jgi:hypothetical protein
MLTACQLTFCDSKVIIVMSDCDGIKQYNKCGIIITLFKITAETNQSRFK